MAKCSRCGISMGFFSTSTICDNCRSARLAELKQIETEKEQHAQNAMEAFRKQKELLLLPKLQELRRRIDNGEIIYFYETVYIPVNSVVTDTPLTEEFSIGLLRKLGLSGWEVVGVIPRTLGVALTNRLIGPTPGSSPETWGAGLGGNVAGVHIILKMKLSPENAQDEFLLNYIGQNMDAFLTSDESQMLTAILENVTDQ
jgi:hypothetical protein